MGQNKKTDKLLRITLLTSCVVLGALFVVMLGGTAYMEVLLSKVTYQQEVPQQTLSLEEAQAIFDQETDSADAEFTGPELDADDVEIKTADEIIPVCESVVNVLLVGADYQSGTRARSDSMILCTFNQDKNTITLTSLMRDMYVQIPGYCKTRINASYAVGGMDLLLQTLKVNFGLEVDGVVEVDFSQFAKLINLLGGVELEIDYYEAKFINEKAGS